MADALSIAVWSGLALACAWAALRIQGRSTRILTVPLLATAMLCGTVVAGSLGLFAPRADAAPTSPAPRAGTIWIKPHRRAGSDVAGHWRTLPDGDMSNNLGAE